MLSSRVPKWTTLSIRPIRGRTHLSEQLPLSFRRSHRGKSSPRLGFRDRQISWAARSRSMHKYLVVLAVFLLFGVGAQHAPAQGPSFTGSFEVADCNSISGWAFDANNLNTTVHVNLVVGS